MFSIKKDLGACERIITFLGLTFRFKSKSLYFRKRDILQNKRISCLEKQKNAILNNLKKQVPVQKSYKYVHIMYNEKFNKPFVDFLNRNFIRVTKYDCNYNVVSSCLLCRSINMQGFSVKKVLSE